MMAHSLDRLTIRGFKSIRTLEEFQLNNLNVFIGGNGAGKSNLVEFFRLLRSVIDGNLNDYIRSGGGISHFLFNGLKVTSQICFEAHFGPHGYRFSLQPGPSETPLLSAEARFYQDENSGWWELGDSTDGKSLLVKEVNSDSSNSGYCQAIYDAISSWQIYHFHDTSPTAALRQYENIQDNKALRCDAANIAPYLLRLKQDNHDAYREILNSVRLVIPFLKDFLLEVAEFGATQKVNLSWQQEGSDHPMQPHHFSDGSIRFICLATALLQPDPPSTIIIDEPELGLHHCAIPILAELIRDAAKKTQLIIATQSPSLIDKFRIEDVVVVNRKDGASSFERLQEKEFSAWLENFSVGELWSLNVISGGPA